MKLQPRLAWQVATSPPMPLSERLLPLLEAIARTGSLAHAITLCGMSYRGAWGLLRECDQSFGVELVYLARGKGATLAPAGAALVEGVAAANQRLARIASTLTIDLATARDPHDKRDRRKGARLRMAASHDLALVALRDSLDPHVLDLELRFVGSLVALEEFADGKADAAGFHMPLAPRSSGDWTPFLRFISRRRDRLIRFIDREQGLMLPAGNPARVKNFRDLARRGLRFVNRQPGSGTRLLIDRHLESEGVLPSSLSGYANEEYTHAAVAATVASHGADAGFGLRAAAAGYGLAFVPVARERYLIAVRAAQFGKPAVGALLSVLRGPEFARIARGLPGYRAGSAGQIVTIERPASASNA